MHPATYVISAQNCNFNPMMAMAADTVVAGVSEIVEAGQIGADYVETPGIFVDYLVGGAE